MDLSQHFLIAMPTLDDGIFTKSLVYICEHNQDGAMGVIVNKPSDYQLGHVFQQIFKENGGPNNDDTLFIGGPVQTDRGFVLHNSQQDWESNFSINSEIQLTTSKDILQAMLEGNGPTQSLVTLGYSGWDASQLEQELSDNVWLTAPADPDILFNTPNDKKLDLAAASIGIDLSRLAPEAGHD